MAQAIVQIGLDTAAGTRVEGLVSQEALDYAAERSADMVGLSRTADGGFYPNPDAEWRIDESTREYLRSDIENALSEGWSNDKLASEIEDSYGFSEDRAMTIARTETNRASNEGAMASYKESGVVDGKQWVTSNDDKVSEDCVENGTCGDHKDGVIMDLEEDYPSGVEMPPNHPNCRCVIVPVVVFSESE